LCATLASVALAAWLGVWQLDRAAQMEALQARLDARAQLPPLAAPALPSRPDDVAATVYRRVRLDGHWLPSRTIFLDNRQMRDKVGFFVVTPFLLDRSSEAVLVQRGWVGRNFNDRTALPAIVTPGGDIQIEGTLATAPARLFEFSTAASGPIRQNVEPISYAKETGIALLPLSILENATPANANDGLERNWPPPATGVQMHYGYAFQWFAIGTVIAFLYVWFRILRPRQQRRA
jgi:surfeit locus 1 family protein